MSEESSTTVDAKQPPVVSEGVRLAAGLFDLVTDSVHQLTGGFDDTMLIVRGDRRRKATSGGPQPTTQEISPELAELCLSRAVEDVHRSFRFDGLRQALPPPGKKFDKVIEHLVAAICAFPGEAYGARALRGRSEDPRRSRARTALWVVHVHRAARLFLEVPERPGSLEREVQKVRAISR